MGVFLGRYDVTPDAVGNDDRAALQWAAEWGRISVFIMLLKRYSRSRRIEVRDSTGRTVLTWLPPRTGKRRLEHQDSAPQSASRRVVVTLGALYRPSPLSLLSTLSKGSGDLDIPDNSSSQSILPLVVLTYSAARPHPQFIPPTPPYLSFVYYFFAY